MITTMRDFRQLPNRLLRCPVSARCFGAVETVTEPHPLQAMACRTAMPGKLVFVWLGNFGGEDGWRGVATWFVRLDRANKIALTLRPFSFSLTGDDRDRPHILQVTSRLVGSARDGVFDSSGGGWQQEDGGTAAFLTWNCRSAYSAVPKEVWVGLETNMRVVPFGPGFGLASLFVPSGHLTARIA